MDEIPENPVKHVLYAEDEYVSRCSLKFFFEQKGIAVTIVNDGIQALHAISESAYEYDLVILDQYMPQMNGDEVANILQKTNPHLTLIGITSDDEEKKHLLDVGFIRVLIKPVHRADYQELIEKYL